MSFVLWLTFVVMLCAIGALAWQLRRRDAQWRGNVKRLADIEYALDRAAIVATTDVTGRITHANDKFCEISGYSRDDLLGQDHRVVNSGLHPKAFIRDLWRTIANGHVWHGELRNRAKDGHFYWVDTTIVPLLDARGKPYQYIAIRSDVTARKLAEDRLLEQGALARVGQMAAVVAHEVKNPLAGIKAVMQVLMARRGEGDTERPVMRDIVDRIDALNELIQDLLVFASPRPLRTEPIDLTDLLRHTLESARRDPSVASLVLHVTLPPLRLCGDAELLKAAFLNIVLNAAQAMGGSGALTVTADTSGGNAHITIADTGPGIPDAIRDRVFEPFFTTRSRGGGLGLPIAKRTIELHGGRITLTNAPAGGTSVRISLPVTSSAPDRD